MKIENMSIAIRKSMKHLVWTLEHCVPVNKEHVVYYKYCCFSVVVHSFTISKAGRKVLEISTFKKKYFSWAKVHQIQWMSVFTSEKGWQLYLVFYLFYYHQWLYNERSVILWVSCLFGMSSSFYSSYSEVIFCQRTDSTLL